MAEERTREGVFEFIKENLAPGIKNQVLETIDDPKSEMLMKEFEKMKSALKNAPADILLDYASLVLPLSQLVTIYYQAMDKLALSNTAYESMLGIIDLEDLKKEKRWQGLRVL